MEVAPGWLHQAVADRVGLSLTCLECVDFLARVGPMPAGKLAELTGLPILSGCNTKNAASMAGYASPTEKSGFTALRTNVTNRVVIGQDQFDELTLHLLQS